MCLDVVANRLEMYELREIRDAFLFYILVARENTMYARMKFVMMQCRGILYGPDLQV
jgi:hypothetical protein